MVIFQDAKAERAPIQEVMEDICQNLEKKSGFLYALSMPLPTSGAGQELTCYVGGLELDVMEKYAYEGAEILRRSGCATDIDTSYRVTDAVFHSSFVLCES